ncbi:MULTISPECIES: MerR family transcriptional regulator [Levilactobacillus]|uniref:MerR family transcriptional regulator n=1 Tax=Levilactobacillus tongjiangensis TaxID=2486023 RepID=A0ABW1SRM0_9LACO|nr:MULTISPECIES: MerR family transcriptional regulator [Levilactobacillus]
MNMTEFAAKVGCSRDTLRFYEKAGLLVPVRTARNYRQYTVSDLATYRIIHSLKRAGLPLAEIKHILQLRSENVSATCCADTLRFITGKHTQFIDNQHFYAALSGLTDEMAEALTRSTLSHSELETMIEQIGELDDQVI